MRDAMRGGIAAFPKHNTEVTDIISAIAAMSIGLITLIAPNISALLNSVLGFRSLFDVLLLIFIMNFVFFCTSSLYDLRR